MVSVSVCVCVCVSVCEWCRAISDIKVIGICMYVFHIGIGSDLPTGSVCEQETNSSTQGGLLFIYTVYGFMDIV